MLAVTLAPASAAAAKKRRDRDGDGLSNRFERKRSKTNPRRRDTDRDNLRDGREVRRLKTNPRRKDTDRDGLRDGREVRRLKTNPRRKDTDRDGLSDRYELRKSRTNPRRKDTDRDGYSDGVEVLLGSNPRSRKSIPRKRKAALPSFAQPACRPGATSVGSATAVRSEVQAGRNVCVTASVGNVNLSSLESGSVRHVGTTGAGSMGLVTVSRSSNIVLRARFRATEIRNSRAITIDNSIIGGTAAQRVLDQLVFIPENSDDVTVRDSDIGWTSADDSGNSGYGLRAYGPSDRLRIERNRFHHLGGDGIQLATSGADTVIDRNEFAYIAPPRNSSEHADDIQVVGHGPNLRITNNYLHHNGWLQAGGPTSGGSGPYIHAGDNDALLFENNLVRDEANFMQVGNLGTGGTVKSNLVFRRNTFYNNGTAFNGGADLYWRLSGGSNNLYERNLVIAAFWNEFGFGSHTTARNNLQGNFALDGRGNCTVAACNPGGQEPIGYRRPGGVHW
jgi:hypothetical protein